VKHTLPPFVIIPSEIFKKRLTLRQIMVLATLYSWRKANTNTVKISRKMISERTGYTLSTISKTTTGLEKLGLIKKSGNGAYSQWCEYKLQNLNALKTNTPPVSELDTPPVSELDTPPVSELDTHSTTERVYRKSLQKESTEKKCTKKKISYAEKVEKFKPNKATANTFKDVYPNLGKNDYLELLEQFKDQALNRADPFKDLNAGMRNYIKNGYIKPVKQVVRKNEIGSFKDIGDIVRAEKKNNAGAGLPKQILINEK
jgi:hypothetical protein